jgi:hypothetical protein
VERVLAAGEVIVNPPGTSHEVWSEEAGKARFNRQTRPALNTETFFETLWGLAIDGKTNEGGTPNLPQVAVIAREYENVFRLTRPPFAVQKLLFAILAPLGKMLGHRARYPEYSGP